MDESTLFMRFGVALAIGILVGMQREFAFDDKNRELAMGVRTLALMALLGCAAAFLSELAESPWLLIIIILILGSWIGMNHYIEAQRGEEGLTTEASALLTVLAGALAFWNQITLAVALGVITAVLLSVKPELHRFAQKLTREDVYATLKMAVITVIILPVLPQESFGPPPFDVLNPFKIWLLVIFISGISFVGFLLIKIAGARKGIGLTGLFGGLASSTAVTLSFTQKSKEAATLAKPFALAITVSWTVMYTRVVIEVAALNAGLAKMLIVPMAIPVAAGLACSLFLFRVQRTAETSDFVFSNPFELGPAITFGVVFSIILVISRAAQVYMGEAGIYLSSIFAGLADVDAIALSVTELTGKSGGIDYGTATRAILIAAVANTALKGAIVLVLGSASLRRAIIPGFVSMFLSGLIVALLI
ncbi:MAG: DUF4010 domain-containing protein [Syntrophales bacterium]|jgi:uncharacterized membrane protein (DUF4010 family)|nr:DUF4010 domain-containing protein [Syntrophales bacterium]MDY0043046.1 MgtC/SapB family protein [Syntrophales bacterium]